MVAAALWPLIRSGPSLDTMAALGAGALVLTLIGLTDRFGEHKSLPIVQAWVIASLVSTGIALMQYLGWADHLAGWVSAAQAGEAWANLRQRNQFASLTVIGVAGVLWDVRTRGSKGLHWSAVTWLALGNAATTSRTGALQMLAVVAVSIAWQGPNRRAVRATSLIAMLAYVVGALMLPFALLHLQGLEGAYLWSRFDTGEVCGSRWALWSNVAHLIAQKPILGWGWGELDFAHFMTLYSGPRFCDILDNAHNFPLHLAVELGVPIALVLCGVALWALFRARPWIETDPTRQLAWLVLVVIAIHSLLEYPLWYGPFQMSLGLSLGLLWPRPATPPSTTSFRRKLLLHGLWPALLLVALAYAAWDYRRVSQLYIVPEARLPAYRENTLAKVRDSWLFANQVRFAELTTTPLTRANAQWTFDTASALLHYSPEPRVIEKVIESATLLGLDDEAVLHLARYRAAFPADYQAWRKKQLAPAPASEAAS